ncbi:MAG: phosphotransferase [Anaerolineales bacterium]|nr:phosphotransferase [Anaerolineales bacterium]
MSEARNQHRTEVGAFLQWRFGSRDWQLSLPRGTGNETYYAESGGKTYFIKVGAFVERYRVMAELGLTPAVLAAGQLADGATILVQPRIEGRNPSRQDFQRHPERFANVIREVHNSAALKQVLPPRSSDSYQAVGLETLADVQRRWAQFRPQVPAVVAFVDAQIEILKDQLEQLPGGGLVASHNDICNGNWLVTANEKVYLVDLETMALDDPALDLGALLWWYYPPEMRADFLAVAGYENNAQFREKMRIRMAIHCLSIILPRENSFDRFNPDSFADLLEDFRAVVGGEENPQGYH